MLDTGMPGIHVVTRERKRKQLRFKKGDEVRISFTSKNGNVEPINFKASSKGPTHIKVTPPKGNQPSSGVFAGVLPYFTYRVLYDSDHGIIGLKLRSGKQ
jgi:hypothetical protein